MGKGGTHNFVQYFTMHLFKNYFVLPVEFQSYIPVRPTDIMIILESKSKENKSAETACLLEGCLGKLFRY